jgi:hypothetical protein
MCKNVKKMFCKTYVSKSASLFGFEPEKFNLITLDFL